MSMTLHQHPEITVLSEIRGDDGRRQSCARVVCASCSAVGRNWVLGTFSAQHSAKHFQRIGWELGRKPTCPDCLVARAVKPPKEPKPMSVVNLNEAKPRALTPDEKTKVRAELDGCFDESRGVYLDGKSDQAIGQKLNLPWAAVRDYREFAYGPLKGNEETAALRTDLDKISADLTAEMRRSSEAIGKLGQDRDRILTKLNALEKRLGFA